MNAKLCASSLCFVYIQYILIVNKVYVKAQQCAVSVSFYTIRLPVPYTPEESYSSSSYCIKLDELNSGVDDD